MQKLKDLNNMWEAQYPYCYSRRFNPEEIIKNWDDIDVEYSKFEISRFRNLPAVSVVTSHIFKRIEKETDISSKTHFEISEWIEGPIVKEKIKVKIVLKDKICIITAEVKLDEISPYKGQEFIIKTDDSIVAMRYY